MSAVQDLPELTRLHSSQKHSTILRILPYAFAFLSVVAFVLFVHYHACRVPPGTYLLGIQEDDTLVYYSCARQWWEEGAGLFYSSPYSTFRETPRIYSHLGFMLAGAVWQWTGTSLYTLDQTIRLIFGTAMLALVVTLFRTLLPKRSRRTPLAALAATVIVCGGGLAWLVAALTSVQNTIIMGRELRSPGSPLRNFLEDYPLSFAQADGGYGDWGANLSRVLPLPFECFYHTLFLAAFLCVAKRRYRWGVFFLFLTWWAHPFTGLEAGFIMSAFLSVELLAHRAMERRPFLAPWLAALLVNALFVGYYALFLPRFPEHASVEHQMGIYPSRMMPGMLLPGYGAFILLLLPAAGLAVRHRWFRRPADRLMAVWAGCVLFLLFHDRVLPVEFQPLHFSRGYLYIPLVYFATRFLHQWTRKASPPLRSRRTALAFLLLLSHLPDTARLYLSTRPKLQAGRAPFTVPASAMETTEALQEVSGSLSLYPLEESGVPQTLVPLFTSHRPLLGHFFNTPWNEDKQADTLRLEKDLSLEVMRKWHLDALVVSAPGARRAAATGHFRIRPLHRGLFLAYPSEGVSTEPSHPLSPAPATREAKT